MRGQPTAEEFVENLSPLWWRDGVLHLLDQRLLPVRIVWHALSRHQDVARAIRDMVVRGAPAIGCAAAYGVVLGALEGAPFEEVIARLGASRPTAVNLSWALARMGRVEPRELGALEREAVAIQAEDIASCRAMGELGAPLLPEGGVLTHCNAGALATGGYGTALGVIRSAFARGQRLHVYVDETRPFLQGARLTAWELGESRIPATLITDNMAAHMMAGGFVRSVIVGADRIAANGDTANKIGTYGLAVLARHHRIPLFVAAPRSTVDLATRDGGGIPIEERAAREVTHLGETRLAPEGIAVANPAFDVTPAALIEAIITEAGVARSPYGESLAQLLAMRDR